MFSPTCKAALVFAALISFTAPAPAQQPDYQLHMNWAAGNWDAGGATNCPAFYVALGVPQFVAAGGRAAVMRYAAAVEIANPPYAFQLVLLTQCHNPAAQQTLMQAGPAVLAYLPLAILH